LKFHETSKCSKWIGYKLIAIFYVSPSFVGLLHSSEFVSCVFKLEFFFHWLSLTKKWRLWIWQPLNLKAKKIKNFHKYMLTHLQSSTLTTKYVSHFHLKLCHDSGVSHILPFTLVNPTPIQTTDNYRYISNYDFSVCFSQLVDLHYNCLTLVIAFSFSFQIYPKSMILNRSSHNFCHHVCMFVTFAKITTFFKA